MCQCCNVTNSNGYIINVKRVESASGRHVQYSVFVYKAVGATDIYRSMFSEICASYDNFDHIYTDGSKMGDRGASAAICSNMVRSTRLPNNASTFRAEPYAITLAMYFVRRSRNSNFVIFSDSMSSIEALNGVKFELDLVQKIIKDYTHLTNNGKTIIFCWIPVM